LAYGPGGTLRYSGNSQQITTDVEFPVNAGPASLVINNLNSVLLHDSRFVHFLDIRRKLYLGSNTLTIDTVSEAATTAFVVTTEGGFLRQPSVGGSQAFFPVGVNSYTPVWIKNSGSEDALSVGAIIDSLSTSDGNTVRVIWNISEDTPGGGNYTIQFGWSSGREGSGFKHDRENLAKIYLLTDTTEAGTGDYTMQFLSIPYTLSRGGITELGPFGIGDFSESTGIDESTEHAISRCELLPNYPNPFSNETTVRFSIPERSFVNLKVYSLLGEEVAELAGKYYPSGMHTETFDGSKLTGSIYLLVFRLDDQVQTRKLVLIK
jgi:hypothetical protein